LLLEMRRLRTVDADGVVSSWSPDGDGFTVPLDDRKGPLIGWAEGRLGGSSYEDM